MVQIRLLELISQESICTGRHSGLSHFFIFSCFFLLLLSASSNNSTLILALAVGISAPILLLAIAVVVCRVRRTNRKRGTSFRSGRQPLESSQSAVSATDSTNGRPIQVSAPRSFNSYQSNTPRNFSPAAEVNEYAQPSIVKRPRYELGGAPVVNGRPVGTAV